MRAARSRWLGLPLSGGACGDWLRARPARGEPPAYSGRFPPLRLFSRLRARCLPAHRPDTALPPRLPRKDPRHCPRPPRRAPMSIMVRSADRAQMRRDGGRSPAASAGTSATSGACQRKPCARTGDCPPRGEQSHPTCPGTEGVHRWQRQARSPPASRRQRLPDSPASLSLAFDGRV